MKKQISIIIPVFNESRIINSTIEHLYTLDSSDTVEIIVVDGSPHGETINTVTNADVKKVLGEKSRGPQMNQGAALANGDVVLFLHADTLLSHDALDQIFTATKQHDIVGGAFDLGIQSEKNIFRLIAKVASIRSRLTRIPYGDQAIFLKKQFFDHIGGFKDIPIMEDVELMQRVKKTGKKIKFISRRVQTDSRRWEKEGIVYCTLRNWSIRTLYLLGVPPEKLKKFYS
ncbi:MAG: TIGR04283 family arsenosugar biosynthesis glycosyltransferase [Desulfobacterales bacterium]|uniref:TIGR04283 family arsenosugar biosynthesis glycosyltransferase n=1 Tax=Candidatus Desulfatibia vada TaxID=2841696 RepID=A0A8J6P3E3_9BACT|nr:TIGR04283 family arsenosugar biosynthesis glycosyltransferase [Candidatus Desulfatibia vada]